MDSSPSPSSSSPRYAASSRRPPPPRRLFRYGFEDDDAFQPRHFLDSCALCGKPLARNRDIFMYRGDTPFCSEDCRQEQIDMDEAAEKKWKQQSPKGRKAQQQQQDIRVRARSTIVAG